MKHPEVPTLPVLYPELQLGLKVSFWNGELNMDLAQERALAILENRDPEAAVAAYRSRERGWMARIVPLPSE